MKLDLAYGARPREVDLPDGARVLEAPASRGTLDYRPAIDRAWAEPFDQPPIDSLVGATDRLAVVVSDETRWLPRREALQSILDRIPTLRKRPVLLVANGKHPARDPGALGIGEDLLARFDVVNHDARDLGGLVAVGTTSTGLRVVVNRALVEADYRIAVGVVRPHYFMGYGGGAKSFVPGVAGIETTAANHRGRVDPSCRLGNLDGNRTRLEIEEAAALAGPATALHLVLNDRRELVRAVAGSLVDAHRVAAEACRAICEAPASPADVVVVSDPLPVTLNLYQALKLLAVAAPLVRSGGVVIVAAECPGGTGPLVAINDLIYKPWLSTLLPPGHRCVLVSDLKPDDVAETFFQSAPSVEAALARAWEHWGRRGSVLAIPRAGLIVPIVRDETEIQAGETGVTDRGRRIGTQRSLEALIRFHRERYPAMEVADVYKLLHQGTMGTQDAVAHPDIAHRRLLVEYGRADARSEAPILEPITLSGQFVRVHLGPAKAQKITPEQISRAAVQSRERMRPDLSAFLGLWLTFREVLAASLGFDLEAVEEFADFAARRGYATQPHSRRYADLYHPSYRLAFLEFLPSSIVG